MVKLVAVIPPLITTPLAIKFPSDVNCTLPLDIAPLVIFQLPILPSVALILPDMSALLHNNFPPVVTPKLPFA